MRCRYCFYEDEAANRTMASMGVMSRDTARLLIREALAAVDFNGRISFAFQGGEPTVAGLDFFRFFVEETRRQNTRHIPIDWSIQTNGLAVDDQWAEFFCPKPVFGGGVAGRRQGPARRVPRRCGGPGHLDAGARRRAAAAKGRRRAEPAVRGDQTLRQKRGAGVPCAAKDRGALPAVHPPAWTRWAWSGAACPTRCCRRITALFCGALF